MCEVFLKDLARRMAQLHVTRVRREFREVVDSEEVQCVCVCVCVCDY